jgi:hypothetical protein
MNGGKKIKEGLQLIHTEIPCFIVETTILSNVLYNHINNFKEYKQILPIKDAAQ